MQRRRFFFLQQAMGLRIVLRRLRGPCCGVFALLLTAGGTVAQTFAPTAAQDAAFNEAIAALKLGNYVIAAEQLTLLAEQGHLAAQYDLGWMRAHGLGGPTDLVAAYQWFALVARVGQVKAIQALEEVKRRMSPAQIAQGEAQANAWRPR